MSDKHTIVEDREIPSGPKTHDDGWLTSESYLAWVAASEGIFLSDQPLSQPPPMLTPEELEEESEDEEVAA